MKTYAENLEENRNARARLNPQPGARYPVKTATGILAVITVDRETPSGLEIIIHNLKTGRKEMRAEWCVSWAGIERGRRRLCS